MNMVKPKGKDISLWIDTTEKTSFPKLSEDIKADVVIVGGGIVGITTAYFLSQEDLRIVLIDKKRIVEKTTGNTTAKITSLHSLIYNDLIKQSGQEIAQLYGKANQEAIEIVSQIITKQKIDCDFFRKSAYTFAVNEKDREAIEKEVEAAQKLGLPAQFRENIPLSISSFGAIEFSNQAQFHPRKYLLHLVSVLEKKGVQFFEHTEAHDIQENSVITENGKIKAEYIVVASHLPFFAKEEFKEKLSRFRDYVIAIRIKDELPNGMFISTGENYHSLRTQPYKDSELLIIDGEGHDIDDKELTDPTRYISLQNWAKENFEVSEFIYYWSTYDWGPKNRIPLAGHYKDNIFLATGFGGWGMSNGTACARLIADLIFDKENIWKELYTPHR